jgi:protein-disulfide isomerase
MPDSPVRIELFTDYQCPVCTRFHDEVESALIRELVDNRGFLFRVTPVALLGEESALAGAYALAARDQGRFEEYAALLYGAQTEINSGNYTEENLRQLASGIGLDTARMESAVERNGYLEVIAGIPPSPGTWGSADLRASQSSTLWMSSAGMS